MCVTDRAFAAVAAAVCATTIDADSAAQDGPFTLAEAVEVLAACPSTPTDPLVIVYTSGSTGRPKGVARDSRSVLHDAWTNGVGTGCYGPGDVVANLLPMAFSAGTGLTFAGLVLGATQQFFDPRSRCWTVCGC